MINFPRSIDPIGFHRILMAPPSRVARSSEKYSSVQISEKGNFRSFKYLCSELYDISLNDVISEISEISGSMYLQNFLKLQKFLKLLKFPIGLKTFGSHCCIVIQLMEISEISVISFFGNLNIPPCLQLNSTLT